jgi:transcriptional regulator with XRE-family HTH domain
MSKKTAAQITGEQIGTSLLVWRTMKGWTQLQMAQTLHIRHGDISQFEHGKVWAKTNGFLPSKLRDGVAKILAADKDSLTIKRAQLIIQIYLLEIEGLLSKLSAREKEILGFDEFAGHPDFLVIRKKAHASQVNQADWLVQ